MDHRRPGPLPAWPGSRVDVGRLEVDGVTAARLEHEFKHRRGVQVVELDRGADPPAHQDLGAIGPPVLLHQRAVFRGVLHAGDVLDALAVGIQELLVEARPADRLDQLEAEPVDRDLGADHPELDRLALDPRVVQQRRLVVKDAPRSPAQGLRVGLQRCLDVADHHGDLGDLHLRGRRDDLPFVVVGHVRPPSVPWSACSDNAHPLSPVSTTHSDAARASGPGQVRFFRPARRRSRSSSLIAASSLVTRTSRNPPCSAPRIAAVLCSPPATPTTWGMCARSDSSIPIRRSWIGRSTTLPSASKNWPRMSPTTPRSRSPRASSAFWYPMWTRVASAVGVPTPTSAYSTSHACFRTCCMVGSSRKAAASAAVEAMIGLGITVAEVRSDRSPATSLWDARKVCR